MLNIISSEYFCGVFWGFCCCCFVGVFLHRSAQSPF